MRLERVVPAVAIILFLSGLPSAASEGTGTLTIVAPGEGATVEARERITMELTGAPPFATIYGYLTLDGEWAGSFTAAPMPGTAARRINASLNATGFAAGAHALGALAYTSESGPVEAPPVSVMLDLAPRVSAVAAYDLDARALRVSVTVEDEGPVDVNLSESGHSAAATFEGTRELSIPVIHGPGNYTASLRATDGANQTTKIGVRYVVEDREADVDVLTARYALGGRFLFEATATDADGGVRLAYLRVGNATTMLNDRNGTFSADLYFEPTLGTHNGSFETFDEHDGSTRVNFTFFVGGPREVLFERTIVTTYGSYEAIEMPFLPAVRGGAIEICVNACGSNVSYAGAATVVAAVQATYVGKAQTCHSTGESRACVFETTGVGDWNLDLAWKQNLHTTVTVRVTGVRV